MSESLETSKIRSRVLRYFTAGKGIDVGCSRDPLTPYCVAFDRPEFSHYPEVTHSGDAAALPFADGEFDWLWSSHVLEDFLDTDGVLREWIRVVRPGGMIGLYVPHPELYAKYGSGNTDHKHPGFYPSELMSRLMNLGCIMVVVDMDDDTSDKHAPRYSTFVIARKV